MEFKGSNRLKSIKLPQTNQTLRYSDIPEIYMFILNNLLQNLLHNKATVILQDFSMRLIVALYVSDLMEWLVQLFDFCADSGIGSEVRPKK